MADTEVKATEHKTLNFSKGVILQRITQHRRNRNTKRTKTSKSHWSAKNPKKTRSIFNRNWLYYNNIQNPYSPRLPELWIRKDSRTRIHPTPIKVQKMPTIWTPDSNLQKPRRTLQELLRESSHRRKWEMQQWKMLH